MPSWVGVAVKVTLVPEVIVLPGLAEMATDGVTVGVAVTTALPAIVAVQPPLVLVATTV